MKITKDSIINDVINDDPQTAKYFMAMGMSCIGCPASYGETIEQACAVHGTDADEIVDAINKYFESKGTN